MSCKVKVNRHGFLAFRIYWNGQESWEGTRWIDTNRAKAEARAQLMNEEIESKEFDYLKWFPEGNRAHQFKAATQPCMAPITKPQTVREFFEEWIEKKKPPFVRLAWNATTGSFQQTFYPFMGDLGLNSITSTRWTTFGFTC